MSYWEDDGLSYWAWRNRKAQEAVTNKSIAEIEKQLRKYYASAMKRAIIDFESVYDKLVDTVVLEGREPTPADLYKLDKYWQAQGQLKQLLQKLGDKSMTLMQKRFVEQFKLVYDAISMPAGRAYGTIDDKTALQMIMQVWAPDGKQWSARIWNNIDYLQQTINDNLIHCVITGKKTSELKEILQERFNVSYGAADSLVRTETAHIQTQAAQQRYLDYGVAKVEVWADKDERRCDVCGNLHKKRYPAGAQMPIPAHPNCRCCIVPVIEE